MATSIQRAVSFRGPLADSYPAAVGLVLLALTPYLVLTTAYQPLEQAIGKSLALTQRQLALAGGMANAAYAVGAVLAVQLASRLPQRRLLVVYASVFIAGSAMAAGAGRGGVFIAGHVLQGLATGLMLIGSVPPLVLSWGSAELPRTAVTMNMGIFGAVALGPVAGGAVASAMTWRPLLWVVAALGVVTLLMALLTYEDQDPQDTDAPIDVVALLLATGGCAGTFFAVSELMGRRVTDVVVLAPLLVGLALLAGLLVHQWHSEDPLIPIRQLAHTIPIAAIVTAMTAGAASIALVELTEIGLKAKGATPGHTAILFLPEFAMAIVTALLFGRLLYTRWVAALALSGLAVLAGGGAVLTGAGRGSDALVLVGASMVGFGVGASVSPALFLTGFSLKSGQLPRVFAFVELLRGVAAFLVAPVLLQFAMTVVTPVPDGVRSAAWIAAGIAALGLVVAVVIGVLGHARLRRPDIEPWLAGEAPAIPSEPVAARVRAR